MLTAGDSLLAVLFQCCVHDTGENVLVHFPSGENVLVPFCGEMYLYIFVQSIELAVCVLSLNRLDATLVVLLYLKVCGHHE